MTLRGNHKVHLLASPSGASYAPPVPGRVSGRVLTPGMWRPEGVRPVVCPGPHMSDTPVWSRERTCYRMVPTWRTRGPKLVSRIGASSGGFVTP